ncbi:MAG: hypothetical protein KDB27_19360 [Planctomycetales bacterium]|nr:hypothetical protein [Planctomycetales bacterium]
MTITGGIESLRGAWSSLWPSVRQPTRSDHGLIDSIRACVDDMRKISDDALKEQAKQLRDSVSAGAAPNSKDVLIRGSAVVCDALRRVMGIEYYDVQLLAGITLSRGNIAEMQTGEGKTFVSALPAFVHALTGNGVHVMTVNDYLAQRDFELIAPVFRQLGMTIGSLKSSDSPDVKRQAYNCDVTYGAGYEFGFDYLRDQAALIGQGKPRLGSRYRDQLRGFKNNSVQSIQRGFAFCVIDEMDSVLIDEATTPLLLSGGGPQRATAEAYLIARQTAEELVENEHFAVSGSPPRIILTQPGIERIAASGNVAAKHGLLRPWVVYVRNAVQAERLLKIDVDYVVSDGKIVLVDKHTGRLFADRSWRDGLHQAVEVKEGLTPSEEQRPVGHITRQRFFRLYDGKCGMTGTATGSENELQHFYHLPVVVIPTRKPNQRKQLPTRYFVDQDSKLDAITAETIHVHATGQPILVGTRTIETSELLAERLKEKGVPFQLLNGKQDEEEADIVSRAGAKGAITIATNMAGRGTDIGLGPGVPELGGLHVIATEHHESARVDRQLIGRSARQGDPGSYQFFVSADDQLISLHAPSLARRIKQSAGSGVEAEADFSHEIAKVQRQVDRLGLAQRQQMFAHDHWLEQVMSTLAK